MERAHDETIFLKSHGHGESLGRFTSLGIYASVGIHEMSRRRRSMESIGESGIHERSGWESAFAAPELAHH